MRSLLLSVSLGAVAASGLFAQADLQGVWVSNSATPLQRPAALAEAAPPCTDAEVAEFQKRADRLVPIPTTTTWWAMLSFFPH